MLNLPSPPDVWQRCFLALAPDAATRDALSALAVPPSARRVLHAQLHLTVAFIGVLSAGQGEALIRRLGASVCAFPPAGVERIECWPDREHPRLMVAAFAMSAAFVELDARVRSSMIGLGLGIDGRALRPHITLARFGRRTEAVGLSGEAGALPSVRFESLVLYSSTLARRGARYEALASVPLG
ncbi:RNA 2',3'-cyclic phosphodiesterase [Burkholderia sp. WAC0059]|uniref:RNA 2',3'-cyclic phosphodiesterase n=1 Tax=Burkholderia sp. WAC0059 TaxID=2066022 RepID=UPI000C7F12E7|nr:RNA 2',3'-cyclic phosphodiesterase [Burkholderia sp. WAC0059]PLZ01354.1 RNA 2',3'-cyclic phosphodiesterase [Burkholderia sp. WAC0059]